MTISGGRFRARSLKVPDGLTTRPSSARLRETLFNILTHRYDMSQGLFVDGCAGSGAIGLEALSRGAERVIFVENHPSALPLLKDNIAALGVGASAEIMPISVLALPDCHAEGGAGVIYLDPPYKDGLYAPALSRLRSGGWIGKDTLVIIEKPERDKSDYKDQGLISIDRRRIGSSSLDFLRLYNGSGL